MRLQLSVSILDIIYFKCVHLQRNFKPSVTLNREGMTNVKSFLCSIKSFIVIEIQYDMAILQHSIGQGL